MMIMYVLCMYTEVQMFDWDEENLQHIARHGVTQAEAEYVLANNPTDALEQDHEERFGFTNLDFGSTMSDRGDNMVRRKDSRGDGIPRASLGITEKLQKEMRARAVVSKMKLPKFASEAEEADWYPAHPEFIEALFKQAEAEGKLGRGTIARIAGLTKPVTIRLSEEDIAKARVQAQKKGVGYQTYMKILLHEALANAERSAA
jgi:uncharacterized protein (DUF4415 family)